MSLVQLGNCRLKARECCPLSLVAAPHFFPRATEGQSMHYYDFNIADYRKDTTHLSVLEHYIYRTLIDWYYLDEKPIPKKTHSVLRRLSLGSFCKTEEAEEALNNVLGDFFEATDEGWVHSRIDEAIKSYHARAKANRENGRKGGRPRKQGVRKASASSPETEENPVGFSGKPEVIPDVTNRKGNQEPVTSNHKPLTPSVLEGGGVVLPLRNGGEHEIPAEKIDEWRGLYPAVDVDQALRSMKGWLDAHPKRQRMKNDIESFVVTWLNKDQVNGGNRPSDQSAPRAAASGVAPGLGVLMEMAQ